MARGIDSPNLDDRTWRQLVDQLQALIPHYAPEWTDRNPSDLGMTLIELFAWLVESMTYRLNRVPEKNYIAFLNLLGITRAPARPATAWLTCTAGTAVEMPKGSQVATEQTEQTAAVVFETDTDLHVLPTNLVAALLIDGNSYKEDITGKLVTKPLSGHTLAFAPSETMMIALGFDQSSNEALALHVARAPASGADVVQVAWCYSHAEALPAAWPDFLPTADETRGLGQSGAVMLSVPAGQWDKQKPAGPAESGPERFWIGLRVKNPSTTQQQIGLAHILFNSVSATNALTITQPEALGKSDGTPFQCFELAHHPLWKRPGTPDPYDHLQVEVREAQPGGTFGDWHPWTRVEQLAPGDARAYRLDPVTGMLYFGDYDASRLDGHGKIPPNGSEIRASYRYVDGGAQGNVGSETIRVARTAITGVTFKNPGPATGGADEEGLADTLRRAPELLRGSTRAITVEDYERLARDASPAVAKVRCLQPLPKDKDLDPSKIPGGLTRHVGHVNLIVVPSARLDTPQPQPSDELLGQVKDYLACRRPLTVQLDVVGPRYLPIIIEVVIRVWPQSVPGDPKAANAWKQKIAKDTRAKIVAFLHPLAGGRPQQGWEIGQDFLIADLLEHIRPDNRVGYIEKLTARAGKTNYNRRPGLVGDQQPSVWMQVDDFELLCSSDAEEHTVTVLEVG